MVHSIIAPTYFWPVGGSDGWTRVVMAAAYVHAVLLNPNSGVGQQREQVFNDVVNASQAAGIKVLGYVRSEYGNRAVGDISQEFDTYSSWYGVDGFFVDEMYHWDETKVSYYQQIHDLAKAGSLYAGKSVDDTQLIFNPGTPTFSEAYIPYADTFVTFEGSADEYQSFQAAAYTGSYNASKFMNIVHTCQTNASIAATLSRFSAQNVEYLYLTNLALDPNPYSDLPDANTWAQELAYIANSTA